MRRKRKYRQVYRKKRWKPKKQWKPKEPEKPKSKLKRMHKYLTSKETKEKVKRGLATTSRGIAKAHKFFEGMGQGIDETFGIPRRAPDYNLPGKKYKKRRKPKK